MNTDHTLEHNTHTITFTIQVVLKYYDNGMLSSLYLNSSTEFKTNILKMTKFRRLDYIAGPITKN
jgi:hypothetical protein